MAWEFAEGTDNAERFTAASKTAVVRARPPPPRDGEPPPALRVPTRVRPRAAPPQIALVGVYPGPRSVVILDNAPTHKAATVEIVRDVNLRGGVVCFLPPYCWDLSPLDNGGYGWRRRHLQAEGEFYAAIGMTTSQLLDAAFIQEVSRLPGALLLGPPMQAHRHPDAFWSFSTRRSARKTYYYYYSNDAMTYNTYPPYRGSSSSSAAHYYASRRRLRRRRRRRTSE